MDLTFATLHCKSRSVFYPSRISDRTVSDGRFSHDGMDDQLSMGNDGKMFGVGRCDLGQKTSEFPSDQTWYTKHDVFQDSFGDDIPWLWHEFQKSLGFTWFHTINAYQRHGVNLCNEWTISESRIKSEMFFHAQRVVLLPGLYRLYRVNTAEILPLDSEQNRIPSFPTIVHGGIPTIGMLFSPMNGGMCLSPFMGQQQKAMRWQRHGYTVCMSPRFPLY